MKDMIEAGLHSKGSYLSGKRRQFCMRALRARRVDDAGQSLLELALTMPLFLLLIVGTAELARFAWAAIEVSNAARAGAQYGAQGHTAAGDKAGIQAAAVNDATNLSGLTATSSYSCTCSTAPTTTISCTLTACPAPATLLVFVQVNTSAKVTPIVHYPGLPTPFTVTGEAIMETEQ
jgi:Flp pilus assembly protein TadG